MRLAARATFIVLGASATVLAIGYFTQQPWALATWPWPEGRLSNVFMASMLAAIAAALLWIGVADEGGAAAPGLLHLAVILGGMAGVIGRLGADAHDRRLIAYAIGTGIGAGLCLALFPWARGQRVRDARDVPASLRAWFIVYIAILLASGTALVLRVPGIMPWPLKGETSTIYGFVFLAATVSFAYPLLRPRFEYAHVGLVGFLAYDAVLLPSLIAHIERVRPELLRSLSLYIAALVVSAAVSVYYLWLRRAPRIVSRSVQAT